jgi:maltose-binding protein MalE
MELVNVHEIKATKKVKLMIAELQMRLLQTEDALEDVARAAEIAQITGQVDMMSAFVTQANEVLANRIVRPDSSITADQHKITMIVDDVTEKATHAT